MPHHWYVLRSKPHKERLLWEQLNIRKVETFFPQVRVQPVNPRARKVKAYFPGYVFVNIDLDQTGFSILQWLPGAVGFVTFDKQPAMVPHSLVNTIKKQVAEINASGGEIFAGLQPGDLVDIRSGPFAGYEAIFDVSLPGSERVRVLLKLLEGRSTKMEIPASQLERRKKRT